MKYIIYAFMFIVCACFAAQEGGSGQKESPEYYRAPASLRRLTDPNSPVNLSTPQACLENFVYCCRDENYRRAAFSLNLQYIGQTENIDETAATLARKLHYVLNQKTIIPWDSVPDRPDGISGKQTFSRVSGDQRNILLDSISHDGRDIEIRLHRVKYGNGQPIWLFDANTVENIDILYEEFGPGLLDKKLPAWIKIRFWGGLPIWEWIMLAILLVISGIVGWAVQKVAAILLVKSPKQWSRGLSEVIPLPLSLASCLLFFYIAAAALLSLAGPFATFFTPVMTMLIIISFTWLLMRVIKFFSLWIGDKYSKNLLENNDSQAGQMLTYTTIIQKVLIFIAMFIGFGIALSQFDVFKTLAASMLASASVAGVVVGIAAHGILSNIMAGIQIAVTQPINIGDNVLFEGNWGNIESISYSYVTILTWDQRRIIVPLKYLLSNPIENWSKKDSHLIKPIVFHVDYKINVGKVRQKFEQVLKDSDEWDRDRDPVLQVLDCQEETLVLRALCSANNPSAAWTLHCKLREQMNDFIHQLDGGKYLPKKRIWIENKERDEDQNEEEA